MTSLMKAKKTPHESLDRLLEIMARLRNPETGCPWDLEQTFSSLVPHTIEEAYEVAHAIALHDRENLKEELGDLLFQIVFYAQMAKEAGCFCFKDVIDVLCEKMVSRHPHVFGDAVICSAEEQVQAWEEMKRKERLARGKGVSAKGSLLDDVPSSLPALLQAVRLQEQAAKVHFDWKGPDGVFDKIREELDEMKTEMDKGRTDNQERIEEEMGDVLFSCVNLARKLSLDPEQALRKGNIKFARRFRKMESLRDREGCFLRQGDAQAWETLWQRSKK